LIALLELFPRGALLPERVFAEAEFALLPRGIEVDCFATVETSVFVADAPAAVFVSFALSLLFLLLRRLLGCKESLEPSWLF
jgi:hypothetical protein